MSTIIVVSSRREYREALSQFLQRAIVEDRMKVLFIDAKNCIDQYMFSGGDVHLIMENLFLARIETAYDLIDMLGSIQFEPYFEESVMMIMSPYNHLLDAYDGWEKEHIQERITAILARLELRYSMPMTIFEMKKKWDTQFRLKG